MKILINGYYNLLPKGQETFSGPRNFVGNFLEYMDRAGHAYTALVLRGKDTDDGEMALERIPAPGGSWAVLTLRLNTPHVFKATEPRIPEALDRPIALVRSFLEEEKPDLVFINGMSLSNWILLKAAKSLGLPVMMSHLGFWYKEVPLYGQATAAGMEIMREMERDMTRLSDKEIFLNRYSMEQYSRDLIPLTEGKCEIVPLAYDPAYRNETLPVLPQGTIKKIGVVGRWDPIKNLRTVLALSEEIKKRRLPWEIHSVTTINQEYPWDRDIAEPYRHSVIIRPPMDPVSLKQFYQEMDLLILPSLFDVSPSVVMEAALQNRITLISPHVGWVSLFEDLQCGDYVTSFDDLDAVIGRIGALLGKAPRPELIDYLQTNHEPITIFQRYAAISQELLV